MEKFLKKFKLDRHHLMERFGITMLVVLILFITSIGLTYVKYRKDNKETLTSQAIYTTSFTTSKTELQGSVMDVFSNQNKTKVLVLLKFNDVEDISVDAKDYEVYLTGSSLSGDKRDLVARPTGCIYMFGHTGYMGVYLVDNRGFSSQIIKMTVRNYNELKEKDESAEDVARSSEDSSTTSDQVVVYFNPGARGATHVECLDVDDVSPSTIYSEIVSLPAEQECKQKLNEDLKEMKIQINRIIDYRTNRFVNDGIAIPELPEELKGDSISDPDENGWYRLTTEHIVPGGYNVSWQDGSIEDGYLDKLCNGMSYSEFFAQKEKEAEGSEEESHSWSETEWYRTDGSRIILGDARFEYEEALQSDIEGYKTALNNYYSLKSQYMRDDMYNLLLLEANTKSVDSFYTVNDNDSSLFIY